VSCSCQHKLSNFCYICGKVVLESQRKPLSRCMRKACELYTGCKIGDQDKIWVLKMCCSSCSRILAGWLKGTHKWMPFAVPMVWHEPQDNSNICYFCMTKITGFSWFSMHKIEYPNVPFALRHGPHDDSVPLPKLPKSYTLDSDSESEENKEMVTPFRNNTRPEECGTSCFSG
jgi:hypothetical protein